MLWAQPIYTSTTHTSLKLGKRTAFSLLAHNFLRTRAHRTPHTPTARVLFRNRQRAGSTCGLTGLGSGTVDDLSAVAQHATLLDGRGRERHHDVGRNAAQLCRECQRCSHPPESCELSLPYRQRSRGRGHLPWAWLPLLWVTTPLRASSSVSLNTALQAPLILNAPTWAHVSSPLAHE